VIISRQKKLFSKWRRSSKSGETIFVFVQWENNNILVEKMKIQQENTKMMPRYSLNLDNLMYFIEEFSIIDQKLNGGYESYLLVVR
jgi:hypothetical protein